MADIKNIKVVDAEQLNADLFEIAEAIRTKGGTGEDLLFPDGFISAVGKIPTGITPTGTKNITQNGTHDVTEFANAFVNVPIPEGYIKPSGNINITTNGTHPVRQYENAVVNVPVPEGYIKISDTKIYVTQSATGVLNKSSDTRSSTVSINMGFRPKIFLLRSNTSFSSGTAGRVYINAVFGMWDESGNYFSFYPDGSTHAVSRGATAFVDSGTAQSNFSQSPNNALSPTATGVAGNNASSTNNTFYFRGGANYFWFAWG